MRWAVPVAFLMHGLGMLGGVYFVFSKASWFTKAEGATVGFTPTRLLLAAVWITSGIAFVAAAWGFWKDLDWWRTAAWIAAPTTLTSVVLAAGAIPLGTYVGAAMAVAVIVALAFGW